MGAGIAGAGRVNWDRIPGKFGVPHVEPAALDEGRAVPRQPGGQHAVKDVDAPRHTVDQILRRAHAHQVAGFVARQNRVQHIQGGDHVGLALAHGQAADGVAGQIKLRQEFGALLA